MNYRNTRRIHYATKSIQLRNSFNRITSSSAKFEATTIERHCARLITFSRSGSSTNPIPLGAFSASLNKRVDRNGCFLALKTINGANSSFRIIYPLIYLLVNCREQ